MIFWILYRCAFNGTCPTLSWNSRLACSCCSLCVIFAKALCLNFGYNHSILANLGELFQIFCAARLSFLLYSCHAVALLLGKIFLKGAGSVSHALNPSLAAFLASSSAFLFPAIPLCPGVHLISTSNPLCLLYNIATLRWKISHI